MTDFDDPTAPPVDPVPYASPVTPSGGLFAPPPVPFGTVVDPNARTMGMLCHLSALVQLLGPPSILGPLVVWLVKKNEIPFVDDQGKEAVNFHLTALIAALVATPTVCLGGIGIPILIAIGLAALVLSIVGAVKANNGEYYRYPFSMRMIK